MIHPSYNELIAILNEGNEDGKYPVINSRYSVVMAAAKRARQLVNGSGIQTDVAKPLSLAVEEIKQGKIKIVEEGVDDFDIHLHNSSLAVGIGYGEEAEGQDADEESEQEDDERDEEDLNAMDDSQDRDDEDEDEEE